MSVFSQEILDAIETYEEKRKIIDGLQIKKQELEDKLTSVTSDLTQSQTALDLVEAELTTLIKALQ